MEFEADGEMEEVWRRAGGIAKELLTSSVVGAFCVRFLSDEWFLRTAVGVGAAMVLKRFVRAWNSHRLVQAHSSASSSQSAVLHRLLANYESLPINPRAPDCNGSSHAPPPPPSAGDGSPAAFAAGDPQEEEEADEQEEESAVAKAEADGDGETEAEAEAEDSPVANGEGAREKAKQSQDSGLAGSHADRSEAPPPAALPVAVLSESLDETRPRRALISLSLSCKLHVTGELSPVIERTRKLRAPSAGAAASEMVNLEHGSRRILQTHVLVRSDLIRLLKNVVSEAAKIDKDCTLQLEDCVMFKNTESGVQMLKLDDVAIPTIIQAESSGGVLNSIKGLHLQGAMLKATSTRRTVVLNVLKQEKVSGGMEVLSCTEPLPMRNMDELFVYASKKVKVDGHRLDVVSAVTKIQDVQLRKAIRDWIPAAILVICVARGIWVLVQPFIESLNYASCAWILPGLVICFLQLLPTRAEDVCKQWLKSLARSIWSIHESLQAIKTESKLDVRQSLVPSSGNPPPKAKSSWSSRPSSSSPSGTFPGPPGLKTEPPLSAEGKSAVPEKPITDPDWQWPTFDEYSDKSGPPKLKERVVTPDVNNSPFQVVYKRKPHQQWPDVVSINLSSPVLLKIIQKLLPSKKDLQYVDKPSVLGKELYHVLDQLVSYKVTSEDVDPPESGGSPAPGAVMELEIAQLHVNHLCRFMEKEYKDVMARVERMKKEKCAPWDMLWVFFPPGAKVGYQCKSSKEELFAKVRSTSFNYVMFRKYWKLDVVLDVYDYNGQSYRQCNVTRAVDEFEGEQELRKLDVCPLEFTEHPDTLEEMCLANGRKFCSYVMKQDFLYMDYRGPLVYCRKEVGCWQLFSCNADGRVMIDLASFAKMNPNYPMGNAQPLNSVLRGNKVTTCDISSDENLVYAPAIVYGFSFCHKQWGAFSVSGFSEITFNSHAFTNLVMDDSEKTLMFNLVSQYLAPAAAEPTPGSDAKSANPSKPLQLDDEDHIDPITNKGEGCIFLCYGPPGTGKTLTAESIAEKLERPLWALSVSELGTNAASLESTLVKVLDIAASWRAVLLLDEADVYLESRKTSDVFRNAMTGVFLRLLEYYRGVLFLTTNRVMTFDEAFLSRISLFLNYKKLESKRREQVWKKLLARARVLGVTADYVSEVAEEDLNGRSIRNIIQTAHTWAKSRGEEFHADHVKSVLKVTSSSLDVLRNSMGHVSDLSYFT